MSEHVTSVRTYVLVFLALCVLTAVTVFVAFQDLGRLNDVVAMAIAVLKATLVVLFFMQVVHSSRLSKIIVAAGFLRLVILIGITLSDYLTRGFLSSPGS